MKIVRSLILIAAFVLSANAQITISVDAADAPRNIVHVRESMPAAAGTFTIFYPKWIPGEHAPTGTVNDVVNLVITGGGSRLEWRRDDVEMFAFHVEIPEGVTSIDVSFDYVFLPYTHATPNLSRLKWNRLIFYPRGARSDDVIVNASVRLPPDWKFASALPVESDAKDSLTFKPVNLTTFIDSPAIIGKYFKRVPLRKAGNKSVPVFMDIVADSPNALNYQPSTLTGWQNLVEQGERTFGARHYSKYDFLLSLSDNGGYEGLEHHESSENGEGHDALLTANGLIGVSELLAHEYTHSWNGKYRRPANLTTPDFEQPMHAELLWVYEGLTQYVGKVLAARSGNWTPEVFRESFADIAAGFENQTARRWRPLVDTARAVQFSYDSPRAWRNARRSADYYDEGALIWLEADVIIRSGTDGAKSLNDFLRAFHGGESTGPKVVTYTFDDVVGTLNNVYPYDWKKFFIDRVYRVNSKPPTGGIVGGGWNLVYTSELNRHSDGGDQMYSLGLELDAEGEVLDVNPDLPAGLAGIAPGMYIRSVNGAEFSLDVLRAAIAATKTKTEPLQIVVEAGSEQITKSLTYKGGERYPHLVRDPLRKDIFSEITRPLIAGDDQFGWFGSFPAGRENRRNREIRPVLNVSALNLESSEINIVCPLDPNVYSKSSCAIKVETITDRESDEILVFRYEVTGGKIIGQGAKVFWDLKEAKPGKYRITASVDNGCGFCGKAVTREIEVKSCAASGESPVKSGSLRLNFDAPN